MNTPTCYVPTKQDSEIAKEMGFGTTAFQVATLRGLYDDRTGNNEPPLDISNAEEAAKTLVAFKKKLIDEAWNKDMSKGTVFAEQQKELQINFSYAERLNRVSNICMMFSNIVNEIHRNTGLDVEDILKGVKINGKFVYGSQYILNEVYNKFLHFASANYAASKSLDSNTKDEDSEMYKQRALKAMKMLKHWPSLMTYAKVKLKFTEGIKIGNEKAYTTIADENNFVDEALFELYDPSENKRESWQEKKDQRSSFGSTGLKVKRFISTKPVAKITNIGGKFVETNEIETDDMGLPLMMNPINVYRQLLNATFGCVNSDEMIGIFLSDKVPAQVRAIAKYVAKKESDGSITVLDEQMKTQLWKSLKKNNQEYTGITVVDAGKKTKSVKKFVMRVLGESSSDTTHKRMIANVNKGTTLSDRSIYDSKGRIDYNNYLYWRDNYIRRYLGDFIWEKEEKSRKSKQDTIENVLLEQKQNAREWSYWKMKTYEQREFLLSVTRALGYDMTMDDIVSIMSNSKNHVNLIKKIKRVFSESIEPNINEKELNAAKTETVSKSGNKVTYYKPSSVKLSDIIKKGNATKSGQSIYELSEVLDKSQAKAVTEKRILWKNGRGKNSTFYNAVIPCYLGDKYEVIQNYIEANDKAGLKKYIEENYFVSEFFRMQDGTILHQWLNELYNACNGNNKKSLKESIGDQYTFSRFLGSEIDNIDFEDFTAQQDYVSVLHAINSDYQTSKYSDTMLLPTFILGDSGVRKFVRHKRYNNEQIINFFYNIYLQEKIQRKLTDATANFLKQQGYKEVENYNSSKKEFTQLVFLNPDFKSPDGRVGKYALPSNPTKEQVLEKIREYLEDGFDNFLDDLDEKGVLEVIKDENGSPVLDKNGYPQYVYLQNIFENSPVKNPDKSRASIEDSLRNIYLNYKFGTIEFIQLMTIDPAFYANTKELQKRFKEIHAPGDVLDIKAKYKGKYFSEDGMETCVYFDDVKINSEEVHPLFMEAIKHTFGEKSRIYKKYKKNTYTDGQGFRSLTGFRKLLGMMGEWNDKYEEAYQFIMNQRALYGRDIPEDVLKEIRKLSVIFQPVKPYLFTHERIGDFNLVPVQHKYAEIALIPELLPKGSMLQDMAYWMEGNNIDMVCSTKCVKVGSFGSIDIENLKGEGLEQALSKAYVHKLPYADYRIQTNVPNHIYDRRLFATQIRKLGLAGVFKFDKNGNYVDKTDDNGRYHYESYTDYNEVKLTDKVKVKMNGRNLLAFFNGLITAQILEQTKKFADDVSDSEKVSSMLIQSVIANNRENTDHILSYSLNDDGNFNVSLFEGGIEHTTSATLLSTFKKRVNKLKINGGAGVQASAMGIKEIKEEEKMGNELDFIYLRNPKGEVIGIQGFECEVPFDFSYKNSKGETVQLEYDDYVNSDGSIKTDENGNTLIEKDFPGILDMITYRIPTENYYSMMRCKIVRFSPKGSGGTIKVPLECTTRSGFDFDIDKLYFIRKEFVMEKVRAYKNLSKADIAAIWQRVYEENKDYEKDLTIAKAFVSGNKPINAYWEEAGIKESKKEVFERAAKHLGYNLDEYRDKEIVVSDYDYSKTILENTEAQRNNMLLHLLIKRMEDYEIMEQSFTPGEFYNATKAARAMRELLYGNVSKFSSNGVIDWKELDSIVSNEDYDNFDPEPDYDYSEPQTLVYFNQQNQIADKVIGIFANHNVNFSFSQSMRKIRLKEGFEIEFAGHTKEEGYGYDLIHSTDIIKELNGDSYDLISTVLTLAEFLSASVDAVKDPTLNYINIVLTTADIAATLARLGYNAVEIGLLFNQPIIKEICIYAANNNLSLDKAINDVTYSYKEDMSLSIDEENPNHEAVSKDTLANNIVSFRNNPSLMSSPDFVRGQLYALNVFRKSALAADEVTQFVGNTRFTASNSTPTDFGGFYAQIMKVQSYVSSLAGDSIIEYDLGDSYITASGSKNSTASENPSVINTDDSNLDLTDEEYFEKFLWNPLAFEQAEYDANRKVLRILSKEFPYETSLYKAVRAAVLKCSRKGRLSAETVNTIHRDLLVYLLSQQIDSEFNGNTLLNVNGLGEMTRYEYFTEHFPADFMSFVENNPEVQGLPIIASIKFYHSDKRHKNYLRIQRKTADENFDTNEMIESWIALSNMGEAGFEMAKRLFLYSFYTSGFDFGPYSFMELAPTSLKEQLEIPSIDNPSGTYLDFYENLKKGIVRCNIHDFVKQFLLNNAENKEVVYQINSKLDKIAFNKTAKAGRISGTNSFVVSKTMIDNEKDNDLSNAMKRLFISKFTEESIEFTPAFMYNGVVYIADGDNFNVSTIGEMRYTAYDVMGSKGVQKHYEIADYSAEATLDFEHSLQVSEEKPESKGYVPGEMPYDAPKSFEGNTKTIEDAITAIIMAFRYWGASNDRGIVDVEEISKSIMSMSDEEKKQLIHDVNNGVYKYGYLTFDGEGNINVKEDKELKEIVDNAKKDAIENGTPVLDSEGNETVSC